MTHIVKITYSENKKNIYAQHLNIVDNDIIIIEIQYIGTPRTGSHLVVASRWAPGAVGRRGH